MRFKKTMSFYIMVMFSVIFFSISPSLEISEEDIKADIKLKTVLYDYIATQYKLATEKDMPEERLYLLVDAIMEASKVFDISPIMIVAVIDTETTFKNIIGPYGEIGYMQIKPTTAKYIVEKNILLFESLGYNNTDLDWIRERLLVDPRFNILVGTGYLKYLIEEHEDIYMALGWYNGGGNTYYANKVVYKVNAISIKYPII
ncbi:transglycosylase SLT domain-containing protein [Petrotoga sp. 9PWA.NaAc.5.4]|uniref:transglycosylase SLT domain-containing protein n=1 Tax=Petrotoga sp. 9PWA.NaAc.5.4 TaxID=1434328 RepID=UPI000CA7B269|nr:transglycosylase SLT domain-containing protein [Petrotoga sp. 9PWA.NaAc.5.4]PNR92419.1 lytic transglycosylase [Petrotoga sp. 9PWA.NaAc.5.4]